MSLVNDALKRAKEAQQPTPAPPISGPPFKEPDTAEESSRWTTSPVTMAVVAVIALLVVWQSLRRSNGSSRSEGDTTRVAARSHVTLETSPATVEPPSPKPEPAPTISTHATMVKLAPHDVTTPSARDSATQPGTTTPPEVTPAAPPVPPPLRLQAVIWNPKRPSAMISGKTVFVGDRIQDFKVTRITQDSATLSSYSEVKVIRMRQ